MLHSAFALHALLDAARKEAERDEIKHTRNEQMKEHDHAPHRQAIVDIVEQSDMKVLICPEDQTQMAVGRELLFDPLPARIKERVVWRAQLLANRRGHFHLRPQCRSVRQRNALAHHVYW